MWGKPLETGKDKEMYHLLRASRRKYSLVEALMLAQRDLHQASDLQNPELIHFNCSKPLKSLWQQQKTDTTTRPNLILKGKKNIIGQLNTKIFRGVMPSTTLQYHFCSFFLRQFIHIESSSFAGMADFEVTNKPYSLCYFLVSVILLCCPPEDFKDAHLQPEYNSNWSYWGRAGTGDKHHD